MPTTATTASSRRPSTGSRPGSPSPDRRWIFAGRAPLQWRVFSCSIGPRASRSLMSEPEARGPEDYDAPLEWRAPSEELLRRDGAGQGIDDGGLARGHLVVDPLVGLLHAVLETDGGRPVHQLLDQLFLAVAGARALGRVAAG